MMNELLDDEAAYYEAQLVRDLEAAQRLVGLALADVGMTRSNSVGAALDRLQGAMVGLSALSALDILRRRAGEVK